MSETASVAEQKISIKAQISAADPNACRFAVSRPVHRGESVLFRSQEEGRGSPLVERLFAIPGVACVLVAGEVVTVGKLPQARWDDLLAPVGAAIRSQLVSGVPAILEDRAKRPPAQSDAEIQTAVEELLDREINPSIASHGGRIAVEKVEKGVVNLRMSGGCQGCAASQLTLRQGVEVMIRRAIPEIAGIVDATDHAAGQSPFYA